MVVACFAGPLPRMMEIGCVYIKLQIPASTDLITLGSEPFATQTQLVGAGIVVALCVTAWLARRDGVALSEAWGLTALFAACALVGGALAGAVGGALGSFSSLGALALVSAAALLARVGLGARTPRLFDVVAPGAVLALAFARLGCLLEGCDFGRPVASALAVAYEAPHPVWYLHATRGLVDAAAPASAAVHPFPLYIVIPTVLIVLASFAIRGGRGTRAMCVVVGYGIARSVAEWFRDPACGDDVAGVPAGFVAAALVGLGAILWWIDSNRNGGGERARAEKPPIDRR